MERKQKVVILCGGIGTRLREETEFRPKPLVRIGGLPILHHIMGIYSHYGYNDFVLCLGYKGDLIKEYFLNYKCMNNDFVLNLNTGEKKILSGVSEPYNWNITFADTGEKTNTGGRIKRIEKYINSDYFLVTYGDGVSDVNINDLVSFHHKHGRIGTITGLHPQSKYGTVKVDKHNTITQFQEKPILTNLINGGFFVFNTDFFDYLDEDCVLEKKPFEVLTRERQIALYKHEGFWHCIDTFKDALALNRMWASGNAPWKV